MKCIPHPPLAAGVVYVGSNDFNVYALNALTGEKIWSYVTGNYVYSSPAVVEGVVYVRSYSSLRLAASTGGKIWSYAAGGPTYSSPGI